MALLADDIGIIHDGILLEENSLDELKKKSEQYMLIQAPDVYNAIYHLESVLNIKKYSLEDNSFIRIYDLSKPISVVGKSFYTSGIELTHLEMREDNLEDYFKKVTGGVGIA